MSTADDIQEIFEKMPEAFRPEIAGTLKATIQLNLSGKGGGPWAIKIAGGEISVAEEHANSPDLTLAMAASDYVDISHGQVNPMNLFMAGKIKLEGDMGLALKFQDLFDTDQK